MERVSAQCCCIPYTINEIFGCNCNGIELGLFKIIQSQKSWCHIEITWVVSYLTSFRVTLYISPFSRYLKLKIFSIGWLSMV